jgi:dTDP-4-dehydrorhamnose 3,5-epimerase
MFVQPSSLPDVLIISPRRFCDSRGWFSETWNAVALAEQGVDLTFVQDNHSYSSQINTVRGLHYQRPPHAQAKLVRCTRGAIFDVAVDVRLGSPTYGRWVGADLTAENGVQLLIPVGFLHGFVTRVPDTEVQYKCSDVYAPECDAGIRWDDPAIMIDWGLTGVPVLSDKDAAAPTMAEFKSPFSLGDA